MEEIMTDLEMPNKETLYFYDHVFPWVIDAHWTDDTETTMEVVFKHDTPIDVLNKYLICRPKLDINFSSDYIIADK